MSFNVLHPLPSLGLSGPYSSSPQQALSYSATWTAEAILFLLESTINKLLCWWHENNLLLEDLVHNFQDLPIVFNIDILTKRKFATKWGSPVIDLKHRACDECHPYYVRLAGQVHKVNGRVSKADLQKMNLILAPCLKK
eukprot:1146766-Amphidinium_carterae.1